MLICKTDNFELPVRFDRYTKTGLSAGQGPATDNSVMRPTILRDTRTPRSVNQTVRRHIETLKKRKVEGDAKGSRNR